MSSWESHCSVQVRRYLHRKCPYGYSRGEHTDAKCNVKVYKRKKASKSHLLAHLLGSWHFHLSRVNNYVSCVSVCVRWMGLEKNRNWGWWQQFCPGTFWCLCIHEEMTHREVNRELHEGSRAGKSTFTFCSSEMSSDSSDKMSWLKMLL